MSDWVEELESLVVDWDAGVLDDVGVERVREILRGNPDAQAWYLRHQAVNAALRSHAETGVEEHLGGVGGKLREVDDGSRGGFRIAHAVAIAASFLVCLLGIRVLQLEFFSDSNPAVAMKKGPEAVPKEPTSEGIALLTRLLDVSWGQDQSPLEEGAALSPGVLSIASGLAQIEFFCGATVVVEGPAELDLRSPVLACVRRGRIRAQVPPAARGFSLEVDDLKVVDLGTEFGLSVTADGANVQVFDGEVELRQPRSRSRLVKAGKSVTRSKDGTFAETDMTPDQFIDIASLESREAEQQVKRYDRWLDTSDRLRADARLVAYYRFDSTDVSHRRLRNSVIPENPDLDGAIVGADRVSGRWSEKDALEFKQPGDRVRVHIPGDYSSLTFACWVRIDSLDRWYNSLFLTDHYNQGEPHWQILDTGQLFFSVRHKADDASGQTARRRTHQAVLSPPFWNPSLSGRWIHLATTYDADEGQTTHYLNGIRLHQERIDPELVVRTTRIGAASIGNWSVPTRTESEFAIRNLNGRMDELAIFSAALSADEILELYENGMP